MNSNSDLKGLEGYTELLLRVKLPTEGAPQCYRLLSCEMGAQTVDTAALLGKVRDAQVHLPYPLPLSGKENSVSVPR